MATEIGQLLFSIEADMTKLDRQMKNADKITRDNFRLMEGRAKKLAKEIDKSFKESASSMDRHLKTMTTSAQNAFSGVSRAAMGVAASALSVTQLARYADSWTSARNKISAAGEDLANVGNRMSQVADIAIRSRSNFDATVDLYAGLSRSAKELGANQTQVLAVTETISKAFTVGGQSASTAAGAILQLNQAFASGKLSGDELNSVLEGAPPLARLIAKEFGVTTGGLKKLGEEGKLTADRVFTAILKGRTEIEAEFAKTNATIAQSFENLKTSFTRWLGTADQATGASKAIAGALGGMAREMDLVAPIAAALGAALLGAFVGGPIGAGIAGVTTALALLGDRIRPIADELATLGDYARAAFDLMRSSGGEAADAFGAAWQRAADLLSSVLSGATDSGEQLVAAVKTIVNGIINAFLYADAQIRTAWNGLGAGLGDVMRSSMNAVIAAIEAALQKIVSGVNAVLGTINSMGAKVGVDIGLGKLGDVNLGRLENTAAGAGEAVGKAFGQNVEIFSQDHVGRAMTAVDGALNRIRQKANEAAEYRAEDRRRESQAGMAASRRDGSIDQKLKPSKSDDKGGGGSGESQNEFERAVDQIAKRARAYDMEREALGKSASEAAKARAEFQLPEAAKKADVTVTDELKAKIGTLADAYAAAKTQLDQAREAQALWRDAASTFTSELSQGLSQVVFEGKKLDEVFANMMKRLASRAFERVIEMLLMGGSGGGGGAMGGILGMAGKAFGFAAGGYTGDGGRLEPAGVVHRGEYVVSAPAVSRIGAGNLEALHRGALRGYADGGLVAATPSLPAASDTGGAGGVGEGALAGGMPTSITIAPVTNISFTMPNGGAGGDGKQFDHEAYGKKVGKQIDDIIRAAVGKELMTQLRPGGTLATMFG